jgi:multidrug efflux pump subunit AcrB
VVALIPLALSSPFWEGLAVVLIFGLLSSTFLAVTVFPYYYLGAEYLRLVVGFKQFMLWFVPTVIAAVAVGYLLSPMLAMLVLPISLIAVVLQKYYVRRLV